MAERKIIIAGVVILAFGLGKRALDKKPLDTVIIGGITFMLLLGLLAAFGAGPAALAGDLAMLALAAVLIADGPAVLQAAGKV